MNVPQPPSAPQNLVGLVNDSFVALAWRNSFEGGEPTAIVLDLSGPVTTSIPLGLTDMVNFNDVPPGSYTISLRAANAAGISASSNAITLSVPAVCSGAPLTPERYLAYRQRNIIAAFWDPAATGPAPTNYLIEVSGALPAPSARQADSSAARPTLALTASR